MGTKGPSTKVDEYCRGMNGAQSQMALALDFPRWLMIAAPSCTHSLHSEEHEFKGTWFTVRRFILVFSPFVVYGVPVIASEFSFSTVSFWFGRSCTNISSARQC